MWPARKERRTLARRVLACLAILTGLAATARPQAPARQAPSPGLRAEEVKFEGAGLKLAGTLLLPEPGADKRAPAVLVVGDSGPTTRDGSPGVAAGNGTYRVIAEYLAARGFVVLRYDKRCVGASECRPASPFDAYVDDARGALAYVRSRREVDPARVAVFGHGEGGLLGSIAAAHDPAVKAVVLAAAPGRTAGKLIREQVQRRLAAAGRPAEETQAYLAKYDRVIAGLTSGKADFTDEKIDPGDAVLTNLIKQRDFTIPLLVNDPLQIVTAVEAPVLVLQGEKDLEVGVRDAQYLGEALKRAHHADPTVHLLPDVDHLLKTDTGPTSVRADEDATRPVDPMLLKLLSEWLQTKLR